MLENIRNLLFLRIHKFPINAQRAFSLVDIFISAMGSTFFAESQKSKSPITGELEYCHPLLNDLSKCEGNDAKIDLTIAEILEIGLYIEAFAHDPCISFCLNNLKAYRQYESTFYQLAMGYRLIKMGCKVALEPITDRGRGDLYYEYKGIKYIAECYRIQKTILDYMCEFENYLCNSILETANIEKSLNVYIKLSSPLSFHSMRQFKKRCFELIDEFKNYSLLKEKEIEINGNKIGFEDVTSIQNDPSKMEFEQMSVPQRIKVLGCTNCRTSSRIIGKNVFESTGSSGKRNIGQHYIYVWHNYKREGIKGPYEILESKLSTKLKQTKSTVVISKRVLFAHFPFGIDKTKKNSDKQIEIIRNASRNFDNLFAVVLTTRQLQKTNRFMYKGVFISPKPDSSINEFISAFQNVEESDFFFKGKYSC